MLTAPQRQILLFNKVTGVSSWDPNNKHASITLSGGNLIATNGSSGQHNVIGSAGSKRTSAHGKRYLEIKLSVNPALGTQGCGVASLVNGYSTTSDVGACSFGVGFSADDVNWAFTQGISNIASGTSSFSGTNNFFGFAVDLTGNKIYISYNGTYLNSGNPGAGTGGSTIDSSNGLHPVAYCAENTDVYTLNVGGTAFNTAAPAGYTAWG